MQLCQVAETSLKEKTYCRKTTYRFLVKKTKEQQASCSTAEICLHIQNNFPLSPRKLGYNPWCSLLFILTKRATKKNSISIYDKTISMAGLIVNASSYFLTLMLNCTELLTVIIWEEQEDSSKKVLKCCFPNCRLCKETKRNDRLYPTISLYHLLQSIPDHFLTGTREILLHHRILCLTATGAQGSSFL